MSDPVQVCLYLLSMYFKYKAKTGKGGIKVKSDHMKPEEYV